ncbi:probable peroxidase 26 [Cornus florida]|uniref:probable peroxidase 26 n=1 Tax=Cornus florida TaxID=4283 RepID=UPI00289F93F4|nr:probable peroxidase 26 [Cornus florida]
MRKERCLLHPLLALLVLMSCLCIRCVQAAVSLPPEDRPLVRHYYKKHNTCSSVEAFVRHQVKLLWDKDQTITPKLLRLLYSDCMPNGCEASILLDGPHSEKTAPQNSGLGGFVVIDKIKTVLENRTECKGVVSCADILNLATRDALFFAGAPSYPVLLGRRDGFESNSAAVDLPSSSISWESALAYFNSKKLDVQDMATLLGAHTMGRTHCRYILDRLYNFNNTGKPDPSMKKSFLDEMRKQCPPKVKQGQHDPLVLLNPRNPNYKFSNSYYSVVQNNESVLGVDQQLLYGDDTNQLTQEFNVSLEDFRKAFALSINRMGGLKVLTGNNGEIRRNCRFTNKNNPNIK